MGVNGCARGRKADIAFENEEDACVSRDAPQFLLNRSLGAGCKADYTETGVVCEAGFWTQIKMRRKGESLLLCSRKTK